MELPEKQISEKRVSDSVTEQIQILMPSHINGFDRLFGGKLVEWIDVVAGVVAGAIPTVMLLQLRLIACILKVPPILTIL